MLKLGTRETPNNLPMILPSLSRLLLYPFTPQSSLVLQQGALQAQHYSSATPIEHQHPLGKEITMPVPEYTLRRNGQPNTKEYRVYAEQDGSPISWWHDIPLYADEKQEVLNMVVEIPRWSNAKLEACKAFIGRDWSPVLSLKPLRPPHLPNYR